MIRSKPTPAGPRFVVVGAGAIGGSVGALLHEAGIAVVLVARGPHLDAMRNHGLRVRLPDRGFVAAVECVASPAEVDFGPGDIVLLATKLQDVQAALDDVRSAAGGTVPVVCLLNGVDGERMAASRFDTVLSTMVWMPATYLVPGEVRVHAAGCPGILDSGVFSGGDEERLRAVTAGFREAGFDAVDRSDIGRWKAAKWITNLGAAAQVWVADDWRRVADAAQAEGRAVLDAAGVDRVPMAELMARVSRIGCLPVDGQDRAGGSTWQSRQRGRAPETPWIEGALARLAEETGVPAPVNARLAAMARSATRGTAAEVLGSP